MKPPTAHPKEALQDLVLDRLDATQCAEVNAHLESCLECRNELDGLKASQRHLASSASRIVAPDSLRLRIGAALDAEDTKDAEQPSNSQSPWWQLRAALVWGVPAMLVIALAFQFWPGAESDPATPIDITPPIALISLPKAAANDYLAFQAGTIQFELDTHDEPELERFFADHGIDFTTRVLDLRMMGYELIGGKIHDLVNHRSAAFAYRTVDGRFVLCRMFAGTTAELPQGAERRQNDGIEFFIYRVGEITVSFWQEGDVVCVLASDLDAEDLIQLSFAKAMKV